MADNELTVIRADGATRTLRDRDISGIHAQKVDVAPWSPTVVAGAEYNVLVSNAAITLTVPATATHALISVSGGSVRFTEDGSSPTSTQGMLLPDGAISELALPNPLKFIRVSVDARINVSYRRYV